MLRFAKEHEAMKIHAALAANRYSLYVFLPPTGLDVDSLEPPLLLASMRAALLAALMADSPAVGTSFCLNSPSGSCV